MDPPGPDFDAVSLSPFRTFLVFSGTSRRFQQGPRSLRYLIVVTMVIVLLVVNANALLIDKDDGASRPEPR